MVNCLQKQANLHQKTAIFPPFLKEFKFYCNFVLEK